MSEKILINILSQEMMPNFIAAMEIGPDRVIALATPRSKEQVASFEKMTGIPHETRAVDPFDLRTDYERVCGLIGELAPESDVVLNFTGGTKVMSLAAALGCIRSSGGRRIELIYVDTERRQLETLELKEGRLVFGESQPLTIPIPLEAYVHLAGETITSSQTELSVVGQGRVEISKELLSDRYRSFFRTGAIRKRLAAEDRTGEIVFDLCNSQGRRTQEKGRLSWDAKGFEFDTGHERMRGACSDSTAFFNGAWLEEVAFDACLESGKFDTVTANIILSLQPETIDRIEYQQRHWKNKKPLLTDKNEVDLVVTKGPRAALCECKSGQVRQDDLYKLVALKNLLLGRLGIAVLISRFKPAPKEIEKMSDLGIHCICEGKLKKLSQEVEALLK